MIELETSIAIVIPLSRWLIWTEDIFRLTYRNHKMVIYTIFNHTIPIADPSMTAPIFIIVYNY